MSFLDKHIFIHLISYVSAHICIGTIDLLTKTSWYFSGFQKSFDCVNHDLLIKKLEYCGIRGNAFNLVKTFISVRP